MEKLAPRARIRDPQTEVTYVVLAYREITTEEARQAVHLYRAQRKKAPKRGSTVIIHTILGFNQ